MATIRIPAHAVVIAIGGKRAPLAEVLDRVPAVAAPWQVDTPDASAENVRIMLREHGRVRVAMPRAHSKAVGDAATIARKHGAASILLRLPGAPDVTKALDKIDQVVDLSDGNDASFEIVPMPVDMSHLTGPFDLIGDVHGVHDELMELLGLLGHLDADGIPRRHPDGRTVVFLGDYTDRGPKNRAVLETVREFTRIGGLAVLGNHDDKLMRWLSGRDVRIAAGLQTTVDELADTDAEWRADMAEWLASLQTHLVLDGGRLVAAHAGLDETLHGRMTPGARSMALYGKPIEGGTVLDEDGYPLAEDWAQSYSGAATVVHGHVVQTAGPRILNRVVALDTGAVFGGSLSAYRYPEGAFVAVDARAAYFERRPDVVETHN